MTTDMTLPADVEEILSVALAGMREALGGNLVGVYLYGSLALGDFDPATSDIDFWAVTERPLSDAEFAALAAMHERLSRLPNLFAGQLEGKYIDRGEAWSHQPGQRIPMIYRGEAMGCQEPGANWVVDRWVVRERGIILFGPDPKTLIAPVSAEDLRAATRARLRDWADFANHPDDPDWHAHRGEKAYFVETMCRMLHTLATGATQTKPQAVAWALTTLPEPWRTTVERSQAWRGDQTRDDALNPEVRRFVLWTVEQGAAP